MAIWLLMAIDDRPKPMLSPINNPAYYDIKNSIFGQLQQGAIKAKICLFCNGTCTCKSLKYP